jgi:hypothetical protein
MSFDGCAAPRGRITSGGGFHPESCRPVADERLGRVKWLLWHGNQYRAGETIGFFLDDVDALQVDYPNLHKFARAAREFGVYIAANTAGRSTMASGTAPASADPHAWPNPG